MSRSFAGRHTMDTPEWYTPGRYVEAARLVLGAIDLDPMSHAEAAANIGAEAYYDEQDDGLALPWCGRVFINPAGGLVAKAWAKLVSELLAERVTAAIWIGYSLEQLQTLQGVAELDPLDLSLCIPGRRINFIENEAKRALRIAKLKAAGKRAPRHGHASHGNFICYAGPRRRAFVRVFSRFGRVIPGGTSVAKRERSGVKRAAPTGPVKARTQPLYCQKCHTRWTEAHLQAWAKCPFKDCDGTLKFTPPGVQPADRFPRLPKPAPTFPLLDPA